MIYKFDNIEVDALNYRLHANGHLVSIEPKVFDLLLYLITNRDRLVTRHEILDAIWQNREVSDTALSNLIKSARKAIGDDGNQQRIIKTTHGRGYQFIFKVNIIDDSSSADLTQKYTTKAAVSVLLTITAIIFIVLFLLNMIFSDTNLDDDKNTAPQDVEQIQKSIAVLAFSDMSPNKDHEYFSDGISEEILNVLAKIPNLHVISKSSAFAFKSVDTNISEIATKLGVKYILEGSVRKAGSQIRITAQLIAADSDKHLWSETYTRELSTENLFKIQDEIAKEVAKALQIQLLDVASSTNPTNIKAYNLYLRGKHFSSRSSRESLELSVKTYQKAIDIDGSYAPFWAGLSNTLRFQGMNHFSNYHESMEASRSAAMKALELDSTLAEAWSSLAEIQRRYDMDWVSTEKSTRNALKYGSQNALVLRRATWIPLTLGESEQALALAHRAVALDPINLSGLANLASAYWALGQAKDEEQTYRNMIELYPELISLKAFLAAALAVQGKPEEGLQYLDYDSENKWQKSMSTIVLHTLGRHEKEQQIRQSMIDKHGHKWAYVIANSFAWHGDHDKAFEWLNIAYEQKSRLMSNILFNPWLAPLHNDPRWTQNLDRFGWLEFWLERKLRQEGIEKLTSEN